jgi:hypothetical protein
MRCLNRVFWLLALCPLFAQGAGTNFQITSFNPTGQIAWTNSFTNGVCTVESAARITNPATWTPLQNFFTTNSASAGTFAPPPGSNFFRLRTVDISTNTPFAYTNLVQSYGLLHTVAGSGLDPGTDNINYWQSTFEGGYATNAVLSRPHFAMADDAGNIYIVDKNSHAVEKVTTNGLIYTVAGTHALGDGPDTPAGATLVAMSSPNGLWVRGDGTFYVMDTGNGKIRRVSTNGVMTTLFTDPNGIDGGRGLWVKDDETLVYYASGKDLRQWSPAGGSMNLNTKFNNLGNLIPSGTNIVATDRDDNTVWLVSTNTGKRTLLFGNGGTALAVDNTPALTNALYGVRGVWQPPTGGYFLATDYAAQFLYVDGLGILHIYVNGYGNSHAGDGQWFNTPGFKLGELRSVSMDKHGNLLIVENDLGFVRKIDFQRLTP